MVHINGAQWPILQIKHTPNMPRGKSSSVETKFTALDVAMSYLPHRTQARFRCISKDIQKKVPSSIKPPTYANILEDLQQHALGLNNTTDNKTCVFADGETWGIELVVRDNGKRVRIMMGLVGGTWQTISTCLKHRVKFVMYRMIQKGKHLKRMGISVEDALNSIVADYADVMTMGEYIRI